MRAPFLPFAVTLALAACTSAPVYEPPPGKDAPGEAASYYAMKRGGTTEPQVRIDAAYESLGGMRRYSVVDDRSESPRTRDRIAVDAQRDPLATWQFLGPGNIGGRTRVLIIDPSAPDTMYAAAVSGGVWKTTDGGARWRPTGDLLANLTVNSLAIHPTDPQTLYAGTGEGYFREEIRGTGLPLRGNGIYVTHNSGGTWSRLPSTLNADFHWVNDLVISPLDPQRIYAATRTGVWLTRDGGTSWSVALASSVRGGCLDLALRPRAASDYLYASCGTLEQATVYRNKDANGGAGWESVLSEPLQGRTSLAIAPSNPDVVYALAASNESGTHSQALLAVFRSDRSGDAGSWTSRIRRTATTDPGRLLLENSASSTSSTCNPGSGDGYVNMGWYCNVIAVDPADENRVWAAGVDLFRSDDGGASWGIASYWWDRESPSFAHADHHGIAFHPRYDGTTNTTFFSSTDGGVYRSDNARDAVARGPEATCDGRNSSIVFRSLNHAYGATQFYHGAVFPDGRRYLGGTQDNGTVAGSIDSGIDGWRELFGGDGGYSAIDPGNPDIIYVEYQFGNIRRSTDGGRVFFSGRGGLQDNFLFITPIVMDPNEPKRLWTGGRRMWRTDDRAVLWRAASVNFAGQVSAIAVAKGMSERVLAGTNAGEIAITDTALSTTGNTTWTIVSPRAGFVSSVAIDPNDINLMYATYAGFGGTHVWRSRDGGVTWAPLDGSGDGVLPDIPIHAIAIDPTRTSRLFLGSDLGVFVSTDGGATWQVENTGFANVVTEWITIGQGARGPAIYAFTHGRGAWRAELVPAGRRRSVGR